MANSIAKITLYIKTIIDQLYATGALTSMFEANPGMVQETAQAGTFMIPKILMQGLGDYSRTGGYPAGDTSIDWETVTLANERGRRFKVDRMDNEESAGIALANLASEFMRTYVIPEIDAIRFNALASKSGISEAVGALSSATDVESAVNIAINSFDDYGVPSEQRLMFMTPTMKALLQKAVGTAYITMANPKNPDLRLESYNGVRVIPTPSGRFFKGITLYDGTTEGQEAGGFIKTATTGRSINFMLVHPSAATAITKHSKGKLFSPDDDDNGDNWRYLYRIYHDLFVLDNKVHGVYSHINTN